MRGEDEKVKEIVSGRRSKEDIVHSRLLGPYATVEKTKLHYLHGEGEHPAREWRVSPGG